LRIAILGYGNVTRALLPLLERDARFEIAGIHSRSRPAAPDYTTFLDQSRAEVLVELTTLNPYTGQPAIDHIHAAFARSMHVVTANKGPIAHAYHELAAEAAARGLKFRFESTVMDGAPVFNTFRNNMPGVRVLGFAGVLNSTTNLILEAMERGGSFEDGVRYAQELGVAEAEPSFDVDGWDAAAKAAALANVLLGARITPAQVQRRGIREVEPEALRSLRTQGNTIRLVARGRNEAIEVAPEVLELSDPLATGRGTSNVIIFETDLMGTLGVVEINPGTEQTAFGVYADLVSLLEPGSR
jgi:homoserine dehydrogenase